MIEFINNFHPIELIAYLLLTVGGVLLMFNVRAIIVANSSHKWDKTSGEVISSELHIIESTGEVDTSYNPKVKYRYNVNGREYTATRVYFGNKLASSINKRKSLKVLKQYPKGAKVHVYFNPMKENLSVLEPGIKSEPVSLILFAIAFIVVGYLIINNLEFVLELLDKY